MPPGVTLLPGGSSAGASTITPLATGATSTTASTTTLCQVGPFIAGDIESTIPASPLKGLPRGRLVIDARLSRVERRRTPPEPRRNGLDTKTPGAGPP